MASYSIPLATTTWQTLPAPSADAWLEPVGGDIYISTDDTPSTATAGVITDRTGYPVSSGTAIKIRSFSSAPVSVRMWDKS